MYCSPDIDQFRVIDSSNFHVWLDETDAHPRGTKPRDYSKAPVGYCSAAPASRRVALSEPVLRDRIKKREEHGQTLRGTLQRIGYKKKNQEQTNGCWGFGPTTAFETLLGRKNDALYESLSPWSVCGPITGYTNVGGWAMPFIEYAAKHGIAPSRLWPDTHWYDNRYVAKSAEERKKYRPTEWEDVPPNQWLLYLTCLLEGPCPFAKNSMRHEMCGIDPVILPGGELGVAIMNSWNDGIKIFTRAQGTPDDVQLLRSVSTL